MCALAWMKRTERGKNEWVGVHGGVVSKQIVQLYVFLHKRIILVYNEIGTLWLYDVYVLPVVMYCKGD